MRRVFSDNRGFTMPELLVVLMLLIGLGIGSYFLLRPVDRTAQEQDAQRMVATAQLMGALVKYQADHGQLPASITGTMKIVSNTSDGADLCNDLVPHYLKDIPLDPTWGLASVKGDCHAKNQQYISSYQVGISKDGKALIVTAPLAVAQPIHLQRDL